MKKVVIFLLFLMSFNSIYSQETYSYNGENLELKTEVKGGNLKFLSLKSNDQFRFFVQTNDGVIIELKNTDETENYKSILEKLTSDVEISMRRLKFTKNSLKNFISFYNYKFSIKNEEGNKPESVNFRLGVSAGVTNNPFVFNAENASSFLIGGEFEMYGDTESPRHSGFLQLRHSFSSDEFEYSTTEFSLGYRYRIINKKTFNIYIQNKFATLNISKNELPELIDETIVLTDIKKTEFNIPLIFGIGADFKISENSYLTFIYGELFALGQENNGNFSTDIALGYKFNL